MVVLSKYLLTDNSLPLLLKLSALRLVSSNVPPCEVMSFLLLVTCK